MSETAPPELGLCDSCNRQLDELGPTPKGHLTDTRRPIGALSEQRPPKRTLERIQDSLHGFGGEALTELSDEYRAKWHEDLLRELRKAYILEQRTRDPELQQIIAEVEAHLK